MYIEKIHFKNSEIFGNLTVNLTSKSTGSGEQSEEDGNKIYFKRLKDGANYYTFIIGDNGVGKTNFLNSIAGLSRSFEDKMEHLKIRNNKLFIKYIGTGLYSRGIENEDAEIQIINPNHVSVEGMISRLFYEYPERINDLQKVLGKTFSPYIVVKPAYNITKSTQKLYVGSTRDIYTYSFLEYLLSEDPRTMQNALAYLHNSPIYNLLQDQYYDEETIFNIVLHSRIIYELRTLLVEYRWEKKYHTISYKYEDEVKSFAKYVLWSDNILNTMYRDEALVALLLENLGLVKMHITSRDQNQKQFPISALSTGEKIMIKTFTYLADLTKEQKTNLIFLYDEPENSLHPKWQQQFPEIIRYIAEDIYHITDSHFIFSTHSPLIVMHSMDLNNSSILSFTRNRNYKFNARLVEDAKRFDLESIMFEQFGLSYYNREKEQIIKETLGKRALEFFQQNKDEDLLEMISSNEDIDDEVSMLFDKISDQYEKDF